MKYSDTKLYEIFFNNSLPCDCKSQDCQTNHRKCYICGGKMQWNEYEGNTLNVNGKCVWNVDHKNPKSHNGSNSFENLIAVHKKCNEVKGDDDIFEHFILL